MLEVAATPYRDSTGGKAGEDVFRSAGYAERTRLGKLERRDERDG